MCRVTHCDCLTTGVPVVRDIWTKASELIHRKLKIIIFLWKPSFNFYSWVTFQEWVTTKSMKPTRGTKFQDCQLDWGLPYWLRIAILIEDCKILPALQVFLILSFTKVPDLWGQTEDQIFSFTCKAIFKNWKGLPGDNCDDEVNETDEQDKTVNSPFHQSVNLPPTITNGHSPFVLQSPIHHCNHQCHCQWWFTNPITICSGESLSFSMQVITRPVHQANILVRQ